jgi:hypothetical protein
MERIKLKDLPQVLNDEIITILATMCDEVPQSTEWYEICENLNDIDYRKIMNKRSEMQNAEHQKKLAQMTQEEKAIEAEKMKRWNAEKEWRFLGNMGEPETAEEYKYKYGVYPPNYKKE